jgi:hypothetical protein
MPVERAYICPPRCRMGAITPEERMAVRNRSPVGGKYDTPINRESAYEKLNQRAAQSTAPDTSPGTNAPAPKAAPEQPSKLDDFLWGSKRRQGAVEAAAKSMTRTMASGVGRQLLRGVLGSLFGGKR